MVNIFTLNAALKDLLYPLIKQAVAEALQEQTTQDPSRYHGREDVEMTPESNLTVAPLGNPDHIGETSSMGETVGKRKSLKKTVLAIRDASDADKAQLLQDAKTRFPFIEEAISSLGYQHIEKLRYNPQEVRSKLKENARKSREEKAFSMLNYQPGSFHTYKSIDKDLKRMCLSMGQARRDVSSFEIGKYYNVKYCRRKINGFFENGLLILGRCDDKKA